MSPLDVINALGGYAFVADSIGVGRTGVFNWIKQGLPASRCLVLSELAKKLGLDKPKQKDGVLLPAITLELLMRVAAAPRPTIDRDGTTVNRPADLVT